MIYTTKDMKQQIHSYKIINKWATRTPVWAWTRCTGKEASPTFLETPAGLVKKCHVLDGRKKKSKAMKRWTNPFSEWRWPTCSRNLWWWQLHWSLDFKLVATDLYFRSLIVRCLARYKSPVSAISWKMHELWCMYEYSIRMKEWDVSIDKKKNDNFECVVIAIAMVVWWWFFHLHWFLKVNYILPTSKFLYCPLTQVQKLK